MTRVCLVKPSIEYKEEYLNMISEWRNSGEEFTPWVLKFDTHDFQGMIQKLEEQSKGLGLGPNMIESSTYWLIDESKRVLGAVNIRHRLNESLLDRGGHIGYGIRPSERKKGFATEMLRQALGIVANMGINMALVTCDKTNIGSAKTIMNNGGVLDSEDIYEGVEFQRYWIKLGSN